MINNLLDEFESPKGFSKNTAGVYSNLEIFGMLIDHCKPEHSSKEYFIESSTINPVALDNIKKYAKLIYGSQTRKKDTRSNWNSGKDVVFDQHMRISYIWALENVLNREGVVASFFPPVVTDSKIEFESDVFLMNSWPITHVLCGDWKTGDKFTELFNNYIYNDELREQLIPKRDSDLSNEEFSRRTNALQIYDFLRFANIQPFVLNKDYSMRMSPRDFKAIANTLVQRNFVQENITR